MKEMGERENQMFTEDQHPKNPRNHENTNNEELITLLQKLQIQIFNNFESEDKYSVGVY